MDDGSQTPKDIGSAAQVKADAGNVLLLDRADNYWERWQTIQSGFVDEPRRAVEEADALVDEVIRSLSEAFSTAREKLEQQWTSGEDVSTEDLRMGLQRYRSFFKRLLSQ